MEFRESASIALQALRANKLRSFLTLLGTIVGVTAVIALISLISGANKYVSEKLVAQGANVFWVDKFGLILDNDKFIEALKRKDLELADAEAVASASKLAIGVRAKKDRNADVRYGSERVRRVPISGMWGDYVAVDRIDLQEGRHLTTQDINRRRSVCVLGYEVWEKLFKGQQALGHEIRIGPNSFDVVGVAEKKGSFLGQSQDNFVIVPLGASDKIYGRRGSIEIGVLAKDASSFVLAQDEARAILRARRHVPPGKDDDFGITTAEMFMDLYRNLTGAIFIVFVGVAAISLVVGGIVIMNIMMVSVTERTREIGIRKALGAKQRDILMQFLVESATLSLTGGAIGVILGSGLALLVAAVSPLPAEVSILAVILGLAMSTSIGLIFGIYPAMRAARLDPIVALRFVAMAGVKTVNRGLVGEILKMAWSSMRANKLRSLLTVLGVIIGVSTVIAMVSLIQGFNESFRRQVQSFGSNTIYVRKWRPQVFIGELPDSLRQRKAFTLDDRAAILAECPAVRAVSPLNFLDEPQGVRYRKKETKPTFILGTTRGLYQETNGYNVSSGRFFTEEEVDHRAQVCVVGGATLETLFPHQDAVGQVVHIGKVPFRVVGELATRGRFLGQSLNEIVMIPYTDVRKYFPADQSTFLKGDEVLLNAVAVSPDRIDEAISQMTEVLRRRRGLKAHQESNFAALTDDSLLNLYNQVTGAFYLLMIAVAFLSLLVGGIGVMNIMLVSVTERTREIGVRMALGAKRSSILMQFLIEAMALTGAGGAIGIAIGFAIAKLVDMVTPLPSSVPIWSVAAGLAFSGSVGLFFGIYPALRASRLDPVEALRYE